MFLKLHLRSTNETVVVNADQIKYMFPECEDLTMVYLVGDTKFCIEVREHPDAIWKMLQKEAK